VPPQPDAKPAPLLAKSKLALLVVGLVILAAAGLKLGTALSDMKPALSASARGSAPSVAPLAAPPVASVPLEVRAPIATPSVAPSATASALHKPKLSRAPARPDSLSDFGGRR
jgi:hypothetical protein